MNIFEFMSGSPVLTFFIVWMLARPSYWLVSLPFRSLNVAVRGWPPSHVDAADRFKKLEKDKGAEQ